MVSKINDFHHYIYKFIFVQIQVINILWNTIFVLEKQIFYWLFIIYYNYKLLYVFWVNYLFYFFIKNLNFICLGFSIHHQFNI